MQEHMEHVPALQLVAWHSCADDCDTIDMKHATVAYAYHVPLILY